MTGFQCGPHRQLQHRPQPSPICLLTTFRDDEGGFSSVATACALLVSLSLVFGSASAIWALSRSADTQDVADAAALAGANVVGAFSTIAQVLDACVLSMGIAGTVVAGAGLVASAIPGGGAVGVELIDTARSMLSARKDFARSASTGLERFEHALPLLIMGNAASCVQANSTERVSYVGTAIPYPVESHSHYALAADEVDIDELDTTASDLRKTAEKLEQQQKKALEALERGWFADCGARPYSLYQRASTLSSIAIADNPYYSSPETWNFGVALARARVYYAHRRAAETPLASDIESITDSCVREAFYEYALAELNAARYVEYPDGHVQIDFPELPHNAAEVRATRLYTDVRWPCTLESGGSTLHATQACPGATGPAAGLSSLAAVDGGAVRLCEVCRMDVGDMGKVAAASTSIENGFEHWWRELVRAAHDYEQAHNEQLTLEQEQMEQAESAHDSFEAAIEALALERPKLCPPGAWGCVAVVMRGSSTSIPSELTQAFLSEAQLPPGAAIAAATLAPDNATQDNDVLSRLFDSLAERGLIQSLPDRICELWAELLGAYGAAYGSVAQAGSSFLSQVETTPFSRVASWLAGALGDAIAAAGFEPADLRLRKPVVVNSQDVLSQAGYAQVTEIRRLIAALPATNNPHELTSTLLHLAVDSLGGESFTIAELPIPGTSLTIPLTLELPSLVA